MVCFDTLAGRAGPDAILQCSWHRRAGPATTLSGEPLAGRASCCARSARPGRGMKLLQLIPEFVLFHSHSINQVKRLSQQPKATRLMFRSLVLGHQTALIYILRPRLGKLGPQMDSVTEFLSITFAFLHEEIEYPQYNSRSAKHIKYAQVKKLLFTYHNLLVTTVLHEIFHYHNTASMQLLHLYLKRRFRQFESRYNFRSMNFTVSSF